MCGQELLIPECMIQKLCKKQFWGQHFWQIGYFVSTTGTVNEKTVRDYWQVPRSLYTSRLGICEPFTLSHEEGARRHFESGMNTSGVVVVDVATNRFSECFDSFVT